MEDRESAIGSVASAIAEVSKRVIGLAALVLAGFVLIKTGFRFGRSLFYADPAEAPPGTDYEVTVKADDDIESVAEKLYQAGIITNDLSFRVQGMLYETELYPGEYTINTSMTIRQMLFYMDERADELKELSAQEADPDEQNVFTGDEGGTDEG